MGDLRWPRVAGFRVVATWPEGGYARPPARSASVRARVAGVASVMLIMGGIAAVAVALSSQHHAPQPSLTAAGALGPSGPGPSLPRSLPVSMAIPAIGVDSALLHLGVGTALFAAILAWQARRIVGAELPELRAVQALGVVIPLFLVLFATFYLSMSNASVRMFSQQLDHTRAIYFTITVFSTVGFGDITPRTDAARLVVSAQMLLDLAIIGIVVRLLFNAAKSRITPATPEAAVEQQ